MPMGELRQRDGSRGWKGRVEDAGKGRQVEKPRDYKGSRRHVYIQADTQEFGAGGCPGLEAACSRFLEKLCALGAKEDSFSSGRSHETLSRTESLCVQNRGICVPYSLT